MNMETASRFSEWLMHRMRPYLSGVVLEVGAGIGNNIRAMVDQERVIATEPDPEYVAILKNAFKGRRRVDVLQWDVTTCPPPDLPQIDTVLCSNVLEHIPDEKTALSNMSSVLRRGGRAVIVVPAGEALYGSLDSAIGHVRRYDPTSFAPRLVAASLQPETSFTMNKPGVLGWLLNGKLLRRKTLGRLQLKTFNTLVPFFRVVDPFLPWPGLSLVVVAKKM